VQTAYIIQAAINCLSCIASLLLIPIWRLSPESTKQQLEEQAQCHEHALCSLPMHEWSFQSKGLKVWSHCEAQNLGGRISTPGMVNSSSDDSKQQADRSVHSSPGLLTVAYSLPWSDSDTSDSSLCLRNSSSCAGAVPLKDVLLYSSWNTNSKESAAAAVGAAAPKSKQAPSIIQCRDDSAKEGSRSCHQQQQLPADKVPEKQQQQLQLQQQQHVHRLDVKTIAATVSDLPILAQCCLLIMEQMVRSALAVLLPAATGAPTWLAGVIYIANVSVKQPSS
jgi:hypothetical protein